MPTRTSGEPSKLASLVVNVGVIAAIALFAVSISMVVTKLADSTQAEAEWDPVLEPYVGFVERERGLTFDRPVRVRFADIAAEVAEGLRLKRESESQIPSEVHDPYGEAYRLLGLVALEIEQDSRAATNESIAANAGAFYDSLFEEIVLPEGASQTAMQVTIVHELVHALQDQNGMLEFPPDTHDGSQARLALVEGDAERIALAWLSQLSPADRDAYLDAVSADFDQEFEDVGNNFLEVTFFASYGLGVPLVETIIAIDGEAELNRLLTAEDVGSSERFVDVLGASNESSVDALSEIELPESRSEADGDLGAMTWFAALAPQAGTDLAFDALIGYDDDAFATFESHAGVTCGRFELFFDTGADAVEFGEVATVAGLDGDVDSDRRSVMINICEPVGDPDDQRFSVLFPLVVVNELALHHLNSGLDEQLARCAALAQAATMPIDRALEDFLGYDELFAESLPFVSACR